MTRHAVLAWDLGGKVLWVEPQYMDPLDCSHAMHIVKGRVREEGGAIFVGDWEIRSAGDIGCLSDSQFDWFQAIDGKVEDEKARLEKTIPELQGID